jgi:hypothetical protein
MHDPIVGAALVAIGFVGGKRNALVLQAAQVLPVPTKDDAREPGGEAACEE